MRPEHETKECSIKDCDELNYSSSTQCYKHLRESSDNSRHNSNRSEYARRRFLTPFDIGVYSIKEGNETVYIGSSDNIPWRLYLHFCKKTSAHQFTDEKYLVKKMKYAWHVIWNGDNLEDARWNERELIKLYQPKFNITHNEKN